jgi:hypothetical protein
MTARHWTLALLALFAAAPARGVAQVAPADSAALLSITRRLLDAITAGDSAVWAPQLSPQWFLTDEEGHHVTRAEFLSDLHPLPSGQSGVLRLAAWHLTGWRGISSGTVTRLVNWRDNNAVVWRRVAAPH